MIRHYLTLARRSLWRTKGYAAINVIGLSIGMTVCALILSFVYWETTFDTFHEKKERIFRIYTADAKPPHVPRACSMPAGMAPTMQAFFPQIEQVCRFSEGYSILLRYDNKNLMANSFLFADSNYFDIFSHKFLAGDPATALFKPGSLVLTEQAAKLHFGDVDPIGKQLLTDGPLVFTVTGVIESFPHNAHKQFSYISPFSTQRNVYLNDEGFTDWHNWNYDTYVLLRSSEDTAGLYAGMEKYLRQDYTRDEDIDITIRFQPITNIHLNTAFEFERAQTSDPKQLSALAAVGIFILLIACLNYMNLATAKAMRRGKEVGVRKVLGAERGQLIRQFLMESVLLSMIALPIALVLIEIGAPLFNRLFGQASTVRVDLTWSTSLLVAAIAFLAGILGGLYPSIFLAFRRPNDAFRGALRAPRYGQVVRKSLIVIQYAISIGLAIGALIVLRQFSYLQEANPGWKKAELLQISTTPQILDQYDAFRTELLRNPGIINVCRATASPGYMYTRQTYIVGEGIGGKVDSVNYDAYVSDRDFVATMGIDLLEGRTFSAENPTDETHAYLVNESMAKIIAERQNPVVGASLRVWSRPEGGRVVGIVRDFHYHSMHDKILPMVIRMNEGWYSDVIIRFDPTNREAAAAHVKSTYEKFSPLYPYNSWYMGDMYNRLYRSEQSLGRTLAYATGLALIIACLGLYGLAAYTAEQRTKEIGVRKVLGASVPSIVRLFAREYSVPIIVANAIAWPATWYLTEEWLHNFAYRVSAVYWVFWLTGLVALTIALVTVSLQAIKAASVNPIESLKYE